MSRRDLPRRPASDLLADDAIDGRLRSCSRCGRIRHLFLRARVCRPCLQRLPRSRKHLMRLYGRFLEEATARRRLRPMPEQQAGIARCAIEARPAGHFAPLATSTAPGGRSHVHTCERTCTGDGAHPPCASAIATERKER